MLSRHSRIGVVSTTLLFVFLPGLAWAQSIRSSINGVVTDQSGAVVANANCTLRAIGVEAVAKFTTGSSGLYRFENLQLGTYDLEVSAQGFQTYIQRGIKL